VVGALGGLVFTLGPAVVHGMNGEYGHAGISAALNLLVPGGVATIGIAVAIDADDSLGGALAGLVIGTLAAGVATVVLTVVDATVLGYKTPHDVMPAVTRAPDGSLLPGLALAF